jgi:hypothetical protein
MGLILFNAIDMLTGAQIIGERFILYQMILCSAFFFKFLLPPSTNTRHINLVKNSILPKSDKIYGRKYQSLQYYKSNYKLLPPFRNIR